MIDNYVNEKFDCVFLPSTFDIHQDHIVVAKEAIRAFKFTTLLGYELPWNNLKSEMNYFNILDSDYVELKLEALAQFESQRNRFYFDRDAIKAAMRFRGLQVGANYSEAFEIIRCVN
jgi:LmbE family N-acetylglucosaminyl deacetylase